MDYLFSLVSFQDLAGLTTSSDFFYSRRTVHDFESNNMSIKKEANSLKTGDVHVELGDIDSIHESVDENLAYREPDVATRLFYAQRYIEKQYDEVSHEGGLLRGWNKMIMRSLKIQSLEPKTNDYPTWNNEDLSLRTSNWIVCAGLLTSEIMGAYLVPNSVAMIGYAPSNVMLSVCFLLTLAAGGITWWMFMLFDSPEYPIKTFADIAYILGGNFCKQTVIFLQIIAMVLTAATSLIGATEAIVILRSERVCWVGLLVLIVGLQTIFGHIRQLSNLGKYCVFVSICNYINLFVQLGYVGGGAEPNWENAKNLLGLNKAPIMTYGITPNQTLVDKIVAISNISYVFAGSVVFPEIISELRRPWDFWKSMISAQSVIFCTYMIYGNFYYANQGQFANSPAVFGISNTKALKGLSFITFLTGFIQGIFYGHLSSKITYKNYLPLIFKRLKFHSKTGLLLWSATVLLIWVAIFVIAAGVPQVSAVSSFTSALTMIPLTYVIPYVFHMLTLFIKSNAEHIEYNPSSLVASQKPSPKKFISRGFKENWSISVFYILVSLASLSFSGLGLYGSVEYMKIIFDSTPATSFSCTSPI